MTVILCLLPLPSDTQWWSVANLHDPRVTRTSRSSPSDSVGLVSGLDSNNLLQDLMRWSGGVQSGHVSEQHVTSFDNRLSEAQCFNPILDPYADPDHHLNLIASKFSWAKSNRPWKFTAKSACTFLCNLANKQTDRWINRRRVSHSLLGGANNQWNVEWWMNVVKWMSNSSGASMISQIAPYEDSHIDDFFTPLHKAVEAALSPQLHAPSYVRHFASWHRGFVGGSLVRASDSRSGGREFDSRPVRHTK